MREILVIVNYMRTNPTIVDDYVQAVNKQFSKIYVVNRNTNDDYAKIRKFKNVRILEIKRCNRILYLPRSLFMFLSPPRLDDIFYAIKQKIFTWKFLIGFAKSVHIEELLYYRILKIKEIRMKPEKVTLLSIWYTSEAFAIARLKSKIPSLRAVSMAHAHEVETFDNKYTFINKKFSQRYLDSVFFIAKAKLDVYIRNVCEKRNLDKSNLHLLYWGSKRIIFPDSPRNDKSEYLIVSCSTVEELKRVDLIAEAVSRLDNHVNWEWYHFGDGNNFDKLKNFISTLPKETQNRIHLQGRIDNNLVKYFYHINRPDIFINVSTTEGLPISVMEALSYEIPAIVTDVGGEKEIIIDGINGYVIDKDINAEILSEYIINHYKKSSLEINEMKAVAFSIWNEKFNLETNIQKYISELLNG